MLQLVAARVCFLAQRETATTPVADGTPEVRPDRIRRLARTPLPKMVALAPTGFPRVVLIDRLWSIWVFSTSMISNMLEIVLCIACGATGNSSPVWHQVGSRLSC